MGEQVSHRTRSYRFEANVCERDMLRACAVVVCSEQVAYGEGDVGFSTGCRLKAGVAGRQDEIYHGPGHRAGAVTLALVDDLHCHRLDLYAVAGDLSWRVESHQDQQPRSGQLRFPGLDSGPRPRTIIRLGGHVHPGYRLLLHSEAAEAGAVFALGRLAELGAVG